MTSLEIIELCVVILLILSEIIPAIINIIKNNSFNKIKQYIIDNIKKAEELYGSGEGEAKKEYVLSKTKELCDSLGLSYNKLYTLINKLIDNIIDGYNAITK